MLKEALDSLPTVDKKQLLYALEQGISQFIDLGDGYFIGVNVVSLEILESIGDWSYGKLGGRDF